MYLTRHIYVVSIGMYVLYSYFARVFIFTASVPIVVRFQFFLSFIKERETKDKNLHSTRSYVSRIFKY